MVEPQLPQQRTNQSTPLNPEIYRLAYLSLARQAIGNPGLSFEELQQTYQGKPDARSLDQSIAQLAFQQGLTKQQVFDLLAVSPQVQYSVKQGQPVDSVKRYAADIVERVQPRLMQDASSEQSIGIRSRNRS
ncbi:hypothetical protein ACQ4M3_24365 [Leptolyngbya sp. AN03gr2]|uniref:hypothetical protein n=1 Tax=unclassified Leptolyngbya TaxID=2650499 RepID=UPI003D31C907